MLLAEMDSSTEMQDVKMLRMIPLAKRIIGVSVRDEQDLSPAVKKALDYIKEYDFSV